MNKKLKVKVDFKTTLTDLIEGFLFCTDNLSNVKEYIVDDKLTKKGLSLLENNLVLANNPHMQLMNQIQIRIQIFNTTRRVLQEFARHRYGNEMTVKSTRYALHKIAKDERINKLDEFDYTFEEIVENYFYIPNNDFIDVCERDTWISNRFTELNDIVYYKNIYKIPNDKLKKYINENMFTDINTIMSGTALKNFFNKRISDKAFYEIRELAKLMYSKIPEEWKFLFSYKKEKINEKS